jgi:hypothetical protein
VTDGFYGYLGPGESPTIKRSVARGMNAASMFRGMSMSYQRTHEATDLLNGLSLKCKMFKKMSEAILLSDIAKVAPLSFPGLTQKTPIFVALEK